MPDDDRGHAGPPQRSAASSHQRLLQPPPRPAAVVEAVTRPARRRAARLTKFSVGLLLVGVGAAILLAMVLPKSASNVPTAVALIAGTVGLLVLAVGLYYRSHAAVFVRLVHEAEATTARVTQIRRGPRGAEFMHLHGVDADGTNCGLTAEGQLFSRCCQPGQSLLCLLGSEKYAAVLLPTGELALARLRRQ